MFHVYYDRPTNCLHMSVKGFWTPEDVAAFAKEVGAKAAEARTIRDDFNSMVESFDFPVQSNEVADLLANIMRAGLALTSGYSAVVVGSHLNKVQAERTLLHSKLRVFMTLEEAHEWLAQQG